MHRMTTSPVGDEAPLLDPSWTHGGFERQQRMIRRHGLKLARRPLRHTEHMSWTDARTKRRSCCDVATRCHPRTVRLFLKMLKG